MLASLVPDADRQSLTWSPPAALGVDRLLLAEIELARQEFSQSWAHATYFDAAASVTFPIFIAKSLEIRVAISGAMSDNIGERRYNKRLGALTTATRK